MTDMQTTTDLERLRDFVAMCSRGDFDGAKGYLSESVTIHEPYVLPYGGDLEGHEGWESFRANFGKTWRRWVDGPMWFAAAEGTVIKENVITATSRRTGKTCTTRLAELFSFVDGKVVDIRIYYQDIPAVLAAITPDPGPLFNAPED